MLAQLESSLITEAGERVQAKCTDTNTHKSPVGMCVERKLIVHAELMMKIHLLLHDPPTTNCLEMFDFRLQQEQSKDVQTNMFLL